MITLSAERIKTIRSIKPLFYPRLALPTLPSRRVRDDFADENRSVSDNCLYCALFLSLSL